MVDRGIDKGFNKVEGVMLITTLRTQFMAQVPCEWMESSEPSLYSLSGTTGKPKGVQRDTGGYAVAKLPSMKHIYWWW